MVFQMCSRDVRLTQGIEVEDIVEEDIINAFPQANVNRQKTRGTDLLLTLKDGREFLIEVKSSFDHILVRRKICEDCKGRNSIMAIRCKHCNSKSLHFTESKNKGHFSIHNHQIKEADYFAFVIKYRGSEGIWNKDYTLYYVSAERIRYFFKDKMKLGRNHSLHIRILTELQPKFKITHYIKNN